MLYDGMFYVGKLGVYNLQVINTWTWSKTLQKLSIKLKTFTSISSKADDSEDVDVDEVGLELVLSPAEVAECPSLKPELEDGLLPWVWLWLWLPPKG